LSLTFRETFYLCWVMIVYFPLHGTWMSTISVNFMAQPCSLYCQYRRITHIAV
jgi:hypothetical protein